MTLTVSEASRAYREKRKAKLERLARLEAALREIVELGKTNPLDFIISASNIARKALADTPPVFSGTHEDR